MKISARKKKTNHHSLANLDHLHNLPVFHRLFQVVVGNFQLGFDLDKVGF
jgi:hypothetical protein